MIALLLLCALSERALPLTTIARGTMSGISDPLQVVVRTEPEWESLWQRHGLGGPRPQVDFGKRMVVGVFLGSRPTAGYSVEIVEVVVEAGGLVVRYREKKPAPDRVVAQVVTAPFHVVSCDRQDGAVRFVAKEP